MKLRMKQEALQKLSRKANENHPGFDTERPNWWVLSWCCYGRKRLGSIWAGRTVSEIEKVV
jgi:hypothetical protein